LTLDAEYLTSANKVEHITIESQPVDVNFTTPHARYESSYRLDGRVLEIRRKLILQYPSRKCNPEIYPELLEIIRATRADHKASVVFSTK
jgi:hypothetical protein